MTTAVRGGAQALTGKEQLAQRMTEKELQSSIIAKCDALGLLSYHTHDSRRSRAGFVDLVIVGPHGGVFWELKTQTGRTSSDQDTWLAMMVAAGFAAGVRRPADLLSGRIADELVAISKHGPRAVA